jgi:hypothetical protein
MAINEKTKLKITVNRGRYNLIFLVLTSVINIFTISSGSSLVLPYSSSISNYAVVFGCTGDKGLHIVGLMIACAVLMLFLICYLLSKTKPQYLIIAFTLVIADTLALLAISLYENSISNLFTILDVFIHILITVYLLKAIKAYAALLKNGADLSSDTEEDDKTEQDSNKSYTDASNDEDEDDVYQEIDEEEFNKPIREYTVSDTDPLVSGTYNGLRIFATIENGIAQLVINGMVCDELDVTYTSEFQLRAIVNNIDIIFDYRRSYDGETMFLYADNELLDSLGRN